MLHGRAPSNVGIHVYGWAAIALGLIGLVWGDFAAVWQPVPASVPHRTVLAYMVAAYFLVAGLAMQRQRTMGYGLLTAACLYLLAALLWAKRVILYPALVGTWLGFAEQLALVAAAVMAYASLAPSNAKWAPWAYRACRVTFGSCAIVFGTAHLLALRETANLVPSWIPPGQRFWAVATGLAHLLAGLAIVSGVQALLAARLWTFMVLMFGVLVWLPSIVAWPHAHLGWAGNAINLAEAGAAWIVADAIARATMLSPILPSRIAVRSPILG